MKQRTKNIAELAILLVCISLAIAWQKKPGTTKINYGNAPRKAVPAAMQGDWYYTTTSSSNMQYSNGHTASAWGFGSTFHINPDGTGWQVITTTTNSYGKETTAKVESDGTFEIEVNDAGNVIFKYYPIQGKVYDNGVYSHALATEKLYPSKFYNWTGTLGKDSRGATFTTGENLLYHR
jgi:hypothetical protein